MSTTLTGSQRKALRGLAHDLKPLIQIGRAGLTDGVLASLDEALADHELVKVRFLDHREQKKELCELASRRLDAALAGTVGHVAIFYRPAAKEGDRRIRLEPG
jgi:RNA-binding protein